MTPQEFTPPGPGTWILDSAHCPRPRTHYTQELFERTATDGFRNGFARYGVLLDTIEQRSVGPFPYMAVRPLGAPPDATAPPPRWLLKVMMAVHPAIRRRTRRAAEVFEQKIWRQDIDRFWRELPADEARIAALASQPLDALDDAAFATYLASLGELGSKRILAHFEHIPTSVLPVGDYLAHVVDWTGIDASQALSPLKGHSPASVGASGAMDAAAAAIASDERARAVLDGAHAATAAIDSLRAIPGPVGAAVARLMDRYGDAILTGHDIVERRLVEMPDLIVATLRARVDSRRASAAAPTGPDETARLRERVPPQHRVHFDELLADARLAYPLRDALGGVDYWLFGVLRRAVLDAGRRLAKTGRIQQLEDVFDATQAEILALLRGGTAPSAGELRARAAYRTSCRIEDAPAILGPAPSAPPPHEWLSAPAARVTRAFEVYRALMDDPTGATDRAIVRGVGASPGKVRGTARLINSPDDFSKLRQGDILVATTTTSTYNAILPLLGGIVTDRGGLLSHPAIVSREYGFPGIVGSRDATKRIPDGSLVELDADAGTVEVLPA